MKKILLFLIAITGYNLSASAQGNNLCNIIKMEAGQSHVLVITADSSLWGWGKNSYNALGTGVTRSIYYQPVKINIPGNRKPKNLAIGLYFSMVVASDSTLWVFGYNRYGALANGTTANASTPVQVNLPNNLKVIDAKAGNYHSVILASDGSVWTSGWNIYGMLGDGTNVDKSVPVNTGLTDVKAIACGYMHSVALRNDNTLWGWGASWQGELGTGLNETYYIPEPFSLPNNKIPRKISAGNGHTYIIATDSTLWASGYNRDGELGTGTTSYAQFDFIQVSTSSGLQKAIDISCDYRTTYAIAADSSLWVWGLNEFGQCGNGTTTDIFLPTRSTIQGRVKMIATSFDFALALTSDNTLWGSGYSSGTLLSRDTIFVTNDPVNVQMLTTPEISIASGIPCEGESLELHQVNDHKSGLSYQWYRNGQAITGATDSVYSMNPAQTGSYTLMASLACGSAAAQPVTVTARPVASFINTAPAGNSVTLQNTSQNGTTYEWNYGDGTTEQTAPGDPDRQHTYIFSGSTAHYAIRLIATNACGSDTTIMDINVTNNPNGIAGQQQLVAAVYPNPASDMLIIRLSAPQAHPLKLNLRSMTGAIMLQNESRPGQTDTKWDIKALPAGIYLLGIEGGDNSGPVFYRIVKK